ncbi:hypothetical protein [Noviherbaspirillum galbum]|uniref:Uncharacterized protein n=1 Tax=Noviherbaspirillum galbum TaxID=2709383 RepID=A0A6B3SRX6_9BURK|nr:hypothetical protein [Noviherbaspirillum galbum]NEX63444.1 hypothetical protein [Noviherbaspirillum galbum]
MKPKNAMPASTPDGFINVAVSKSTRQGLHHLKESMGAASQAEVVERLVRMALAIEKAAK